MRCEVDFNFLDLSEQGVKHHYFLRMLLGGFQIAQMFVSQVEEYQGMLENSGLVGYAQEVLKETDQSCFVQTAKQLHVR